MYDYTFEHLGADKEVTDDYIDKQINSAFTKIIQNLGITLDDIGRRTQTEKAEYDGKAGTRIEYLITKNEKKVQWLIIFFNERRNYLKITSEVYLGLN